MGCKNWWDQTAWDDYLGLWSLFLSFKLNAISAPAGRCRASTIAKVGPSFQNRLFKTVFSTQTFQHWLRSPSFSVPVFQSRFFSSGFSILAPDSQFSRQALRRRQFRQRNMTADRVPLGRCLPRRDIAGANRPQTARATALKRAACFGW